MTLRYQPFGVGKKCCKTVLAQKTTKEVFVKFVHNWRGASFLGKNKKLEEGKKSASKPSPPPLPPPNYLSSSSGSVTVSKEDQHFLCFLTYHCNYFARHRHSLVNIYSCRNPQHLHTVLGHDRNVILIDTRQYLQ